MVLQSVFYFRRWFRLYSEISLWLLEIKAYVFLKVLSKPGSRLKGCGKYSAKAIIDINMLLIKMTLVALTLTIDLPAAQA
jgi:hypothetical protein